MYSILIQNTKWMVIYDRGTYALLFATLLLIRCKSKFLVTKGWKLIMEEIFKQYGGPIITVLVIVAILAIMAVVLKDNGLVHNMFSNLLTEFLNISHVGWNSEVNQFAARKG